MHPAPSVIAFTTLSGAGYGLAFVLALGHGNPAAMSTKIAWFTALALIAVGLMCSTLHLGNPQRAWRAFSQWRSSWLSREGVMAVLTFIPLAVLAGMSIFGDTFNLALGYLGGVMCAITVFCTAMIYASLRTIPSWHTRWTPGTYLAFALTGYIDLSDIFWTPTRFEFQSYLGLSGDRLFDCCLVDQIPMGASCHRDRLRCFNDGKRDGAGPSWKGAPVGTTARHGQLSYR